MQDLLLHNGRSFDSLFEQSLDVAVSRRSFADFSDRKDQDRYQQAFQNLLRDLKAKVGHATNKDA